MKRFKFRLQSVLEQRERRENQAVQSYAEAKRAIADATSILTDLKLLRQELMDSLSQLRVSGSIDPQEQLAYQEFIKTARLDIGRQEAYIAELTEQAEGLRLHLVDASQDKQAIDKMKVKSIEKHQNEALHREQEDADEMATLRHQYGKGMDKAA